jgi:kexin
MRLVGIAATLGLAGAVSGNLHPRSQESRDFFALHLDDTTSPSHIAQVLGARHEGKIGELAGHHTFSLPRDETTQTDTLLDDLRAKRKLRRRSGEIDSRSDDPLDGVLWSHKLAPARQRLHKRLPPVSVPYEALDKRKEDAHAAATQKNVISTLGISDPSSKSNGTF